MQIGVSMPRIPDGPGLREFVQAAEAMGFESVLIGDHIVLPTGGTTQYPYTASGGFSRPADEPFLETMTLLGYLAACTDRIKLGSTVLILPYRNPVVQAKMFASLDSLTGGRMICGIGVGWLEKEFDTLGVSYAERGPLTDEFLQIFRTLWYDEHPSHNGKHYQFDGIQFYPSRCRTRCPSGSVATPGPPCAGRPGTATAGTPPGRRRSSLRLTYPTSGRESSGRNAG